ncbi:MAG TPA: RNA polymerase sigma factor [Prolixibacteraceae bacterium]|nr:RNA polymerase sigma factor [Prolixibacteraceae bacterium]HPR61948.1 RNA polymerase sigma factor [Prolixibacteraceae bacterium]
MKNKTDEYLVSEIASGKLDYSTELFERYHKQLLNYFYRSTRNLDDSKDLTQDVFIKVLKYARSFKNGTSFKFWLFKIAKNLLNTYYSTISKSRINVEISSEYNIEDEAFNVCAANDDETLFSAISKLPEEYRELIILSRFSRFKYSDIAEMYQTTEASIKNKLYRALMILREIYFESVK